MAGVTGFDIRIVFNYKFFFNITALFTVHKSGKSIRLSLKIHIQPKPNEEKMMRLSEPRVPPMEISEMDEEQRHILERASFDEPINIFKTLVRHKKLMKRWLVFSAHVLNKSTLPARERELVILRIGWRCKAEYEWAQHVVIGKAAGLTEVEIDRITQGPDAKGWSNLDQTLLRATDELHDDAFISDETWNELTRTYDENQIMDLIFAVGNYQIVSMALNSLGVQLDPGLTGFKK
jgi:4-carboxymuconolactone decarboxylase